jgi:predicted metal-dependent peptidase
VQAEAAGKLAAGTLRQIRDAVTPRLSYAEHLRKFVSSFAKDDSSWSRPNRRTVGIEGAPYLPSLRSEAVGKLVVGVDTSGSISQRDLEMFQAEFAQVHADMKPEEVVILYCDAAIAAEAIQRVGRWEEPRFDPACIKGGGGTDFRPVFKWVSVARSEGENIVGIIYITDLDGDFPKGNEKYFDPMLPVLWVSSDRSTHEAPFGETCFLINR